MADKIRLDFSSVMAPNISSKHGLTTRELRGLSQAGRSALDELKRLHKLQIACDKGRGERPTDQDQLEFAVLPDRVDHARDLIARAKPLRQFDNLVVLGIGGSALGVTALHTALNPPFYNMLPRAKRGGPRLFVEDNIDPDRFGALLDLIDPRRTLFCVTTKSGSTAETMSQYVIARQMLRRTVGKGFAKHIVAITDPCKGDLRTLATRDGSLVLDVPPGVGGRFSGLTPVGLFPAAVLGIDILGLLAGARAMRTRCFSAHLDRNPAWLAAAIHYLLDTGKGKHIAVMMSYSDALNDVADWFRQLWAESLGKERSLTGKVVHAGQTPVKAIGVTDQHSQVQLYRDGPNDKMFTFLAVDEPRRTVRIPKSAPKSDATNYLAGRSLNELFDAERRGTQIALTEAERPNSTLHLPRVDAQSVGGLLFLLEMQTAFAGALYNINAYDQPGVEAGKIAAFALMGRPGYENKLKQKQTKQFKV